jgi:hypothetical protein
MKAAVLHSFKTPLSLEEVPRPEVGTDEVLIDVEVCGVCHSDLHVADGDWTQFDRIVKKPLILGHEIVGRVVERGAAVQSVQMGERVGVPWVQWTCGQCEFCREGNENLCVRQRITGVTVDGGYAEFAKAPASHVIKIPENLSSEQAAPLLCAGVTVHRALKQANLHDGGCDRDRYLGGKTRAGEVAGRRASAERREQRCSEGTPPCGRSTRCPGDLGCQVRIRYGVLLCATNGHVAGRGITGKGPIVSRGSDGGWRNSYQGVRRGHTSRSARNSGDGGSRQGPLPGGVATARRGSGGAGAIESRRNLRTGGALPVSRRSLTLATSI